MPASLTETCVMRVFNGPMAGTEFVLSQGLTRVLVGAPQVLAAASEPDLVTGQALLIALEQGGCSFEILLSDPLGQSLKIRPQQTPPTPWQEWPLQQQRQIGGLQLAFRSSAQAWDLRQPPVAPSGKRGLVSIRMLSLATAVCLLAVSVAVWSLPDRTVSAQQRGISTLVSAQARVLQGRDLRMYVLVDSQREASWNRQVLMRHQLGSVAVVVTADEQRRLEQHLLALEPGLAIRLVDLRDPRAPVLVLAGTPIQPALKAQLEAQLLRAAPYAGHLEIRVQDDSASVDQAIAGLRQIGVPFQRHDQHNAVALRIEGNLQDSQLQATRRFIQNFEQQWGTRFVHFSIVLQDDRLKGLSQQAGEQGYIKTSSASWQFHSPRTGG
ncbi:PrgH/EprH family type III secretion apparatus protein [Pseudomonas rubra]|uniref:PrgH/EprH family type III secretion apparatus protein n=1 Tax=Pseudomonas rubra TaxID=2942627 RepID=A0ABT5PCQ4_9PSED|nr:PrgH/EprH family type III secretion apparatus protein [Pseudomonas rubra]MDD1016000.1 PrgH/EprH family type III secretion apparatus protein [Pseudomonas rubra]MDD1039229.1 PrgH/EprH family type III secretion apparatus protein [Pseudomonas rubra]MDD1155199.1 PrgH/EprH family type III secretion apparatus protein [Pseudomonas rubra]